MPTPKKAMSAAPAPARSVAQEMGDFLTLGPIRRSARHPQGLAFYAGLGAVVALEVIDWPVALVAAFAHALAQTHNRTAEQLAEGLDA
jgi:hypothetical protein